MSLKVLEAVFSEGADERERCYVAGSDLLTSLAFDPKGSIGTGQSESPIAGMKDFEDWKKAVNTLLGPPEQWIRFGAVNVKKTKDSYYMNAEGIMTQGVEERGGPSYNELTRLLAALKMSDADIAKGIRKLLTGVCEGNGDAAQALSCLTAAMFLAEPKRNHRAFAINLMLLDFVEGGVKYGSKGDKAFSWDRILWRTGFGDDRRKMAKDYEFKPTGQSGRTVTERLVDHQRGGKLPMSHTNAVQQSGGSIPAHPPADTAIYLPNSEIEKECTIVVRWLANILARKSASGTRILNRPGTGATLVERLRTATTGPVPYRVRYQGLRAVPMDRFVYLDLSKPLQGSFGEILASNIKGALA